MDKDGGRRIGISFRYQNEAFRGSNIDPDCTLQALQRTLALKQDLTQWEGEKLVLRATQVQQEQLSQAKEAMEQQQRLQKQEQELQQQQRQRQESDQQETHRQTVRQVPRLRIHH
jgi:hypothetical protein